MLHMNREFGLVVACCRWPPSTQRNAAIASAAAWTIDWTLFSAIATRHRVSGLVWNGLSKAEILLPTDVCRSLKAAAGATAQKSLLLCAEALRLQGLFDQEDCKCAFVKGSTVAALAYGDCGIRQAKDIDVIVPRADLKAAGALLLRAGYRRIRPTGTLSDAQWTLWLVHGKDTEWRHVDSGINLELHWRLTDIAFLLQDPPDFAALQTVELTPAAKLRTLPPQNLFVYLCVHGAVHGWCRLKWLADVHALLAHQPLDLIDAYYAAAQARGAERAMGQALLLCNTLFDLPLPEELAVRLRSSRVANVLERIGLACLMRGRAAVEIYDQPFGSSLCSASHMLLATHWRSVAAETWRKGINLNDVMVLRLPAPFTILYWLLRAPLWLWRRAVHVGASRSTRR